MTKAPTTRETADHAELARRLREDADWQRKMKGGTTNDRMLDQAADALETLLSEIAALRGERDDYRLRAAELTGERDALKANLDVARDDDLRHLQKATQAERQRDELRKALVPFAVAAANFDENDTCDAEPDDYVFTDFNCLSVGHLRSARQALANQGPDQ